MAHQLVSRVSSLETTIQPIAPALSTIWGPEPIWDTALATPATLKSLCPACFGLDPPPNFAVICFDGNFQQKRTKTARNDSRNVSHLRGLFVENAFQSKEELELEAPSSGISKLNYSNIKTNHLQRAQVTSKLLPSTRFQKGLPTME